MASIYLYLKNAISADKIKTLQKSDSQWLKEQLEKKNQILISVSINGTRFKVYTGKTVAQQFWDLGKQNIDLKKNNDLYGLKEWLNDVKVEVERLAVAKELKRQWISRQDVSGIIERMSLGESTHATFDDYFNRFLEEHKTTEGHTPKPNTVKKYRGFLMHLKAYAKKKRLQLEISSFDLSFLIGFKNYLVADAGLADNTVSKYAKCAKTFIRFYMRRGKIEYYDIAQVVTKEREGEIHVLSIKEVRYLQNLQIDSERLSRARDLFCFMCWTGQRSGDYLNINRDDIQLSVSGELNWELITQKKQRKVIVPIVGDAKKILDKYEDYPTPIPTLSNQVLNRYLKELGQLADFNRKEKIVQYHDGVPKPDSVPFYQVLTTHVARKSFITNSLYLEMPERLVRDISDHQDEKSFRRYVKLSQSYKTSKMQQAFSEENIEAKIREMGAT